MQASMDQASNACTSSYHGLGQLKVEFALYNQWVWSNNKKLKDVYITTLSHNEPNLWEENGIELLT